MRTYCRRLLGANSLVLASIAFLSFPTGVVAQMKAETGPVMMLLTAAARRRALLRPGETRGGAASVLAGMAATPAVFIAAACLAVYHPRAALYLLLLLIPAGWLSGRIGRIVRRRIDAIQPLHQRGKPLT